MDLEEENLQAVPLPASECVSISADAIYYQCLNDLYLEEYLRLLKDAGYDFENEATCRLAANCLIVPAAAHARRNIGLICTNKRLRSSLSTTPYTFFQTRE
jgi:hypothetical protein